MSNAIKRAVWLLLGTVFGVALTGTIVFFFPAGDTMPNTSASGPASGLEYTSNRPVTPPVSQDDSLEVALNDASAEGKTNPAVESPQTVAPFVPASSVPASENAEFKRVSEECERTIATVAALDAAEPRPNCDALVARLTASARSDDERRAAASLEKRLTDVLTVFDRKAREYRDVELGRILADFARVRACPVTDVAATIETLCALVNRVTPPVVPEELKSKYEAAATTIRNALADVTRNRALYTALAALDRDADYRAMAEALRGIVAGYPDSRYAQDFARVLKTFPAFEALDEWNTLVATGGSAFDRYIVAPEIVASFDEFYRRHVKELGGLTEWKTLPVRLEELRKMPRDIKVCARIAALLEYQSARSFWIYRKSAGQWYYLPGTPRVGTNRYVADLFGTEKNVSITADELETVAKDEWTAMLAELAKKARTVTDETRTDDPAGWYRDWMAIVEKIRTWKEMDPIVRFLLLKDTCSILASGDARFATTFAPWLRVLNSRDFMLGADWYKAGDKETPALRIAAAQLLRYLQKRESTGPGDTKDLNATVTPVAFAYTRIGWLDRAPDGSWVCRTDPKNKRKMSGDLFVLRLDGDKSYEPVQAGRLDAGAPVITLASNELLRGMPVVVRYRFL